MCPEWMIIGQRLGLKNIQRRPGNMATRKRRQQIRFDEMTAARDIDDIGILRQLRQGLAVNDILSLSGQRQ